MYLIIDKTHGVDLHNKMFKLNLVKVEYG